MLSMTPSNGPVTGGVDTHARPITPRSSTISAVTSATRSSRLRRAVTGPCRAGCAPTTSSGKVGGGDVVLAAVVGGLVARLAPRLGGRWSSPPAARSDQRHHLLNGLPRHPQLSSDVRLRQTIVQELLHQVASLAREATSRPRVLHRLRADLLDPPEYILMACLIAHEHSMTTQGCHSSTRGCHTSETTSRGQHSRRQRSRARVSRGATAPRRGPPVQAVQPRNTRSRPAIAVREPPVLSPARCRQVSARLQLSFETMGFFDSLDTNEALAHEAGLQTLTPRPVARVADRPPVVATPTVPQAGMRSVRPRTPSVHGCPGQMT